MMTKTIELTLTDWGYGPAPFGRIPAANGKQQLVFVPGTVDGDVIQAQVVGASGAALWATPTVYISRAPEREKSTCAGAGHCECSFQHITYSKQIEIKRAVLENHFVRFGPKDFPTPTIIETTPPSVTQRNHVRLQPDEARKLRVAAPIEDLSLPFKGCSHLPSSVVELLTNITFGEEENDLTAIDVSINANDEILVALRTASGLIPEVAFDIALNAVFLKPDGRIVPLSGDPYLWQWIGEKANMIPAGAPYPHWEMAADTLCNTLKNYVSAETSLLNINCGAAWLLNSMDVANNHCVVVEENEEYVEAIATNLDHFANVDLYQDELSAALTHLTAEDKTFDVTIFQSAGRKITGQITNQLAQLTTQRLVLIGQTPIGLAKDVQALTQHRFSIEQISLVDTAPYTHKFTPIAVLLPK